MKKHRSRQAVSKIRLWIERLIQVLLGGPGSRESLLSILRSAHHKDLFDADALAMIEGVLQVSEMQVRDIMIPRSQMIVVLRDDDIKESLPQIIESGHSRFPVIGDSRDKVVGILLAKDLLHEYAENETRFDMHDVLRPAVFVPESKRLNVLLKEFRVSRNHIAIVVDEYGGVAGMVTIEDVLEQIVGEIEDEHDVEDVNSIFKHSDSNYTLKALTTIEDFNAYFETDFVDDEYDTIAGMMMRELGCLPKRGDTVTKGKYSFKVLRADNRRVHVVRLTLGV
ncbi:MAG: CBS domain-containing protein [Gammaproteobacteria bacterium]|nr:CBS domain-containing protein [Gammaproteobacteria bacterium]